MRPSLRNFSMNKKSGINAAQSSVSVTVPAPMGGLNGRDPLANMPATDAFQMDNVYPDTASCRARRGHTDFTTAALNGGVPVEALEVYTGAVADKMLGFAGSKIYTIATNGVPTEVKSGLNHGRFITAMFSNASDDSQHMIMVNGADTPLAYDNTTVNTLTMTGIATPADLNFVFSFKERLFFAAKDKLGFYYLPVGQIQGALTYYDLAQVSRKGGYLLAIASISLDAGETPSDLIVFITSKGELIVFNGTDPSSASAFCLVGRWFCAAPIGRKCVLNFGTELVIITRDGLIAASDIRRTGDPKADSTIGSKDNSLSSKLGKYLSELVPDNATVHGWTGLQYDSWLLLSAPVEASTAGKYYQFVMNVSTGAWCRFTGWNGICWTVFNNALYFGKANGHVMKADTGADDDGADILIDVKQAYNYFEDGSGLGQLQKHFQWAQLIVVSEGIPAISGRFNVDFKENAPEYLVAAAGSSGSLWDVSDWDVAEWASDGETQRVLVTLNNEGYAGSLWMRSILDGIGLEWFATQYVMQKTRSLL